MPATLLFALPDLHTFLRHCSTNPRSHFRQNFIKFRLSFYLLLYLSLFFYQSQPTKVDRVQLKKMMVCTVQQVCVYPSNQYWLSFFFPIFTFSYFHNGNYIQTWFLFMPIWVFPFQQFIIKNIYLLGIEPENDLDLNRYIHKGSHITGKQANSTLLHFGVQMSVFQSYIFIHMAVAQRNEK